MRYNLNRASFKLVQFNQLNKSFLSNSLRLVQPTYFNRKMSNEVEKAKTAVPEKDSIFSKIIRKEIKSDFIYEDDLSVVIKDINPISPVHLLVIPKKQILKLSMAEDCDKNLLGHLLLVAQKVAKQTNLDKNGFRIIINDGVHGCQSVYHLHLHVIGGKQLSWS